MSEIGLAFDFLTSQSVEGLVRLFWFTLSLEIPRYACGFIAFGLAAASTERRVARAGYIPLAVRPTVSVMVIGHNEAGALERCLRSLREQTLQPTEVVVVSDGSSDGMRAVASRLVRQGLLQHAMATDLRGGKAAGFNLALRACRGQIVVNVDCDCSYDRFALESIVAPFAEPDIGAVSGELAPRNGAVSLIARLQEIEYLLSLSVGRRVAAGMNQVSCVSGGFGAFRRIALEQVGGCDVGGGEDFDLTLRLRGAGWRIAFAPDATCYTDVPAKLWTLVNQRLRWERDAIRLRCRKHRRILMASKRSRGLAETVHQWDYLVFELGATVVFPLYVVWLLLIYGGLAVPILLAMRLGLLVLDTAVLALAALVVPRSVPLSSLLYMPAHSVYSGWVMRSVRLLAIVQEWFLFASRHDNYVPDKVRLIRKW
jgi:cellulose synthase/poly-beta-1,6-N-acetylglucosamine synthase-like glycosyltransferase